VHVGEAINRVWCYESRKREREIGISKMKTITTDGGSARGEFGRVKTETTMRDEGSTERARGLPIEWGNCPAARASGRLADLGELDIVEHGPRERVAVEEVRVELGQVAQFVCLVAVDTCVLHARRDKPNEKAMRSRAGGIEGRRARIAAMQAMKRVEYDAK